MNPFELGHVEHFVVEGSPTQGHDKASAVCYV